MRLLQDSDALDTSQVAGDTSQFGETVNDEKGLLMSSAGFSQNEVLNRRQAEVGEKSGGGASSDLKTKQPQDTSKGGTSG